MTLSAGRSITALVVVALWAAVMPGVAGAAGEPTGCADFDELPLNAKYSPGQKFASGDTIATVVPFTGDWGETQQGRASVMEGGAAGGSGHELHLDSAGVEFRWEAARDGLELDFGEGGGAVSLEVNGELRVIEEFAQVDGKIIGDVAVEVTNRYGDGSGVLSLRGPVSSLVLAGAKLWVDDLCGQCAKSAHFEDLAAGSTFGVGSSFASNGVAVSPEKFFFSMYGWTSGGSARVDGNGRAGGSGQDVWANNVGLRFDFGAQVQDARFRFGEYAGNINLEVNGDYAIADDFAQLNGLILGGVTLSVTNGRGSDTGKVELSGTVNTLLVGGQELWLDDVCGGRRTA